MIAILLRVAVTSYLLGVAQVAPATASRISGTVRDLCGLVMPGATVSAVNREEGFTTDTRADGSGRYVLHIQPGTWALTFDLTGFRQHRQDVVITAQDTNVELNIRLPLLGRIEKISTHPEARYQRYVVQGVVRADDGAGIPQAIIRLRAKRPTEFVIAGDVCTTDNEGRYTTAGWSTKPIPWRMSVEADNYRPYDLPDLDLTVDEAKTIDIRLQRR